MNFSSDNTTGIAPEIMAAIVAANEGADTSYGEDAVSARLTERLGELFETEVAVFPVATGTAANALALSVLTPPYGAIYCHREAHVEIDECGAPEFYSGGAKVVPLDGDHGRIAPETLEAALVAAEAGFVHHVQPAALSLTQATECGTVYAPGEVAALTEVARRHGLGVHMDGARFANAMVRLGCTPAEATWRAGIDVLSFGATKNGALAAEAVILFRTEHAGEMAFRRKRAGHLFSKMRFIAAQLEAYVADDLWLRNAAHANQMAARIAAGLAGISAAELAHPVEGNELFVCLPDPVVAGLRADGFSFFSWGSGDGAMLRLVTAYDTRAGDVDAFLASTRRHADAAPWY